MITLWSTLQVLFKLCLFSDSSCKAFAHCSLSHFKMPVYIAFPVYKWRDSKWCLIIPRCIYDSATLENSYANNRYLWKKYQGNFIIFEKELFRHQSLCITQFCIPDPFSCPDKKLFTQFKYWGAIMTKYRVITCSKCDCSHSVALCMKRSNFFITYYIFFLYRFTINVRYYNYYNISSIILL